MAEEAEYTEAEYRTAERQSDQNAVGYVLVVCLAGGLAAGLSAVTGLTVGWAFLLVMTPMLGGFLIWVGRRGRNLPRPRLQPLRLVWPLKALAILLGAGVAALLLMALVAAIVGD